MNKFFSEAINDMADWVLDQVNAAVIAGWITIAFFVILVAIRFIVAGILVIPAYNLSNPGLPMYLAVLFVMAMMIWGWSFKIVKAIIEKAK